MLGYSPYIVGGLRVLLTRNYIILLLKLYF